MAKRHHKAGVVGGFDMLKAAQRAAGQTSPETPDGVAPVEPPPSGSGKIASRINHTALPTRHDITCYECGFDFQLTGRTPTIQCPKCRKMLQLKDYTIEGHWSEEIKTAGKVHVLDGAVLTDGLIIATDIILEGRVEGATLQASRWFEVGAHADYRFKEIKGRDLRVAAEAQVTVRGATTWRNVEVLGSFKAKLRADGMVTVKPGGCLAGSVEGSHLVVEEGGGLTATVKVEPESDNDE